MKKNLIFINSIILTGMFLLLIMLFRVITFLNITPSNIDALILVLLGYSLICVMAAIISGIGELSDVKVFLFNFIISTILGLSVISYYLGEEILAVILALPTIIISSIFGISDMIIQYFGHSSLFVKKEKVKKSIAIPIAG